MGVIVTMTCLIFLSGIYAGLNIADWRAARRPAPVGERFWREMIAMLRKSATMNRFAGNCVVNRFECEISQLGRFQFTVEAIELHPEQVS
jgi:hypothetical protein